MTRAPGSSMGGPGIQHGALLAAGARFADLLRAARAPQRRMPRSRWSPAETGVHVLQLLRVFERLAGAGTSPYTRHEEFPRISDELIAAEPERDPAVLAAALEEATRSWLTAVGERLPTDPFDWHGIVEITLADASGILLGELLLHGRDIARAEHRRWPIAADDARTVLTSILPLLPFVVEQERAVAVSASYELRIRGMPTLTFRFRNGELEIGAAGGPVDCHLAGDAVAVLLVAYGRWSQWQAIGRGRLFAWGRRPLLALRFTSLLRNP